MCVSSKLFWPLQTSTLMFFVSYVTHTHVFQLGQLFMFPPRTVPSKHRVGYINFRVSA